MADQPEWILRRRIPGRSDAECDHWVLSRDRIRSFKPLVGTTTDGGASWAFQPFYFDNNEGGANDVFFFDQNTGRCLRKRF